MNLEWRRVVITAVVLAVFFGLGVGFVAYTQQKTADQIELNRQAVLLGQIMAVLQGEGHDNNPAEDAFLLPDPEALDLGAPVIEASAEVVMPEALTVEARERAMNAGQLGFRARQDGEVVAVAIPVVTHRGYSGDIRLLVGIKPNGELTGVRVLEQNETPGLGDKIKADKTDWIEGFAGRRLGDPPADAWAVKKDGGVFDQFTGATVSPRAVVAAVKQALDYAEDHHRLLFDQVPTTREGLQESDTALRVLSRADARRSSAAEGLFPLPRTTTQQMPGSRRALRGLASRPCSVLRCLDVTAGTPVTSRLDHERLAKPEWHRIPADLPKGGRRA